jgi:hypothetical protein
VKEKHRPGARNHTLPVGVWQMAEELTYSPWHACRITDGKIQDKRIVTAKNSAAPGRRGGSQAGWSFGILDIRNDP